MVGIAGVLIFLSMRGRRLQIFIYNFKIVFDDGLLQMACWGLILLCAAAVRVKHFNNVVS